ncbi:hypothetical protein DPMN_143631 [Dreissena polymorpha]|uniref:Uncharacterized protein n=1 Tax=Dreissena polymorpha TaxID=45954 RepID=A0A9D4GDG8_DREPO|nr:hypothetical protein DPMN_143631 [Dreissena polymorpha]
MAHNASDDIIQIPDFEQTIPYQTEPTASTTTGSPEPCSSSVSSSSSTVLSTASPFSKHLQLPHAPLSISKAKAKRKSLQKAVTGVKFRQIMIERQKQKEKLEREKQKRRES